MDVKNGYSKRIHSLDTIRGIAIIGVVIYHILFDLVYLFGVRLAFFDSMGANFIRDFGAGVLIFLSGIACCLSRSNLKRGFQCYGIAMIFTIVTYFIAPDELIFMGVLHLLGIGMIAYHFYGNALGKVPVWVAGVLFIAFLFLFNLGYGTFGFFGQAYFRLPADFQGNVYLNMLGFPYQGVESGDYFPILPWFLLFLSGNIFGRYFKSGQIPKVLYRDFCPPVSYIGTKTIFIYALHQPVVYGLLSLIFYLKETL